MKTGIIRSCCYKMILWIGLLAGLAIVPAHTEAHPLNNGYSQIHIDHTQVSFDLFIPENSLLTYDLNGDKHLTEDEWTAQKSKISKYLQDHLDLQNNSEPMNFSLLSIEKNEKEAIAGVTFHLFYSSAQIVDNLTIRYNLLFDDADPAHLNFAIITNGSDMDQTIWDSAHRIYHYEPFSQSTWWEAAWEYLTIGVEHILSGTDHLLFLLSLILIVSRIFDIVKIITAFTVAHSITLFLAASGVLTINSRIVESAIALTIAYVAIENVLRIETKRRWFISLLFGLIHGMGFAGALKEVGLPQKYFISSLLSFNVGVEIGQLALVMAAFPLLLWFRKFPWYRSFVYTISGLIVLIALYWFAQRIGWV
jgi:hydrogenase/urease accessory protein HupE